MTTTIRHLIMRANAIFLLLASAGGLVSDLRGIFAGAGPVSRVLAGAADAGIGFLEAHGLALILGVLLWRAAPSRQWHLTGLAIHVLLGTANLACWQIFITADMLTVGYVTTALHGVFAALQLSAAATAHDEVRGVVKAGAS